MKKKMYVQRYQLNSIKGMAMQRRKASNRKLILFVGFGIRNRTSMRVLSEKLEWIEKNHVG